ncbi:MAG TPA: DUF5056 domain-containing protein [Candidatus Bacteroides merdigallinarum]|uniref:DUF5056 domain-containing protein n=1 Tax=Candidatus Bacteroides merdigallinarum TaxID=2838473 RepID=A0A9D2J1P5_9BACE|nr:DUF5056 domain-containing protein [Candidatus Bacteroides merdigallinarum]
MMENNDQLIEQFLAPARKDIPDDGFTKRVMQRVPDRHERLSQVWNYAGFTLALALFLVLDGVRVVWDSLRAALDGMLAQGLPADADPRALLVAGVVLLFLCYKKIASLA